MPITWKNIAAPDFSASNKLAQAGQEQIQGAVDSLRGIMQDRGERQTDERENAALQHLSSLGTAQEVEDNFAEISASLGDRGDQAALLAAKNSHLNSIFNRDRNIEFASQKANRQRESELKIENLEYAGANKETIFEEEQKLKQLQRRQIEEKLADDAYARSDKGKKEIADSAFASASLDAGTKIAVAHAGEEDKRQTKKEERIYKARFYDEKSAEAVNQDVSPGGNVLTGDDDGREAMNAAFISASTLGYTKADILKAKKAAKSIIGVGWDVADILPWLKKNAIPRAPK